MSYVSTFGSFTQARLAIYASQAGLTVTGNNIANINTEGYTRQRLDQTSFYAGSSDRYSSELSLRIGYGTLATGVSQLRDPYLDIRYRNEASSVGYSDATLSVLEQIESILDEVGDGEDDFGIIADQLSDLYKMLAQLNDQTGHDEYDILVRTSAQTLTNLLNSYSSQLEEVYNNTVDTFNTDVGAVNTILNQIQGLNESIRKAEIYGDKALELRDERNLLLDKLATYVNINVRYEYESIGAGVEVEKLMVEIEGTDTKLVDGIYVRQLVAQFPQENPNYNDTQAATGDNLPYLDVNGNPVADEADAKLVNTDNYDIALTALADSKGRLQFTVTKGQLRDSLTDTTLDEAVYNANQPSTSVLQTDGTYLVTVYTKDTVNGATVYYAQEYTRAPSTGMELGDNVLYGSLQALREMLTEEGEFASAADIAIDPDAATKRGIPYYQQVLNLFAYQLANTFNTANQGYVYSTPDTDGNSYYVKEDGTRIQLEGADINTDITQLTEAQKTALATANNADPATVTNEQLQEYLNDYLKNNGGQYLGAVLFSNNGNKDDPEGITASNISISATWAAAPSLVRSFEQYGDMGIGSTESSNILHMIALMNADQSYDPTKVGDGDAVSTSMFNGSFSEYWNNIGITLGKDMNTTSTLLDTHYATAVELESSRDSVSAVDLNDEAMNLSMYQQAYNAACRLMTTLDSVLDKLVNGTGMTT